MRRNIMPLGVGLALAACAGAPGSPGQPGPGDAGYAYNVDGRYAGRLVVESEPFDATLDLETRSGGMVRGSFAVRAPLEVEGAAAGRVVDDLVRLTLTYERPDGAAGTCESRIEGILTVSRGGAVLDGPVTITDCGEDLPGRVSFRRQTE